VTSYLGYDVLEKRSNATLEAIDTITRIIRPLDHVVGARTNIVQDFAPKIDREFLWSGYTSEEIVILRNFFKARRGKAVPFWVPTWRRDLFLHSSVILNENAALFEDTGYSNFAFQHKSRRHIAFMLTSGPVYKKVSSASSDGFVETITFTSNLPAIPLDTLVCFLTLCRLNTDNPSIEFITNSKAESRIPYIEIPEEAP
jgi:hypothetical protein